MKKTFKKIISVVAVAALLVASVFSLASCGGDSFKDGTIKIGATGPLTGDVASYGISVQQGAKLAIEHLNAKGGMQFSFVMKDDQGGAEAAGNNYDILADAGMQLSLGGVTSGAGEAFATKANADGVFAMSPSASADPVIKDKATSFRLCFGDPDQGVLAAEEIDTKNYAKVGAIYDESDSYSSGIYAAFEDKMEELGIEYTVRTFNKESNKEFSAQAEALKDCDVIFMPFYYTEAQLFIKAAVAKDCDAVFFGCDGFDGIAEYVEDVENKIMYITPFDVAATDEQTVDFVTAYEAKYSKKPDQFAADAYDVVMVIAAALEAAGVDSTDMTAQELSALVIEAVTSSSFSYDGLTGVMTWDASGACTKEPNIVELN